MIFRSVASGASTFFVLARLYSIVDDLTNAHIDSGVADSFQRNRRYFCTAPPETHIA